MFKGENIMGENYSTKDLPYSYHTFVYPFSYKVNSLNKDDSDQEKMVTFLKSAGWESENFYNKSSEQYPNQLEHQYNSYQYFLPKARPNVFNIQGSSDISQQFIYKLDKAEDKNNEFRIITRDKKSNDNGGNCNSEASRTIILKVDEIKLSIFYKMDIGVLSIETQYYHDRMICFEGDEKEAFEIACIINDMGRRLFSPVYDLSNDFTAQKIELTVNKKDVEEPVNISVDFLSEEDRPDISKSAANPQIICKFITMKNDSNCLDIQSILDDRMYVVCLIRDNKKSEDFKEISNPKTRENLYRFAFCDSKDPSCQNDKLLLQKLEEHVYLRWQKFGTIQTVNEYAFNCVTGEKNDLLKPVIWPFITMYTEMVKLALAQRAAIVKLESEAGDITNKFEFENENVDTSVGKQHKENIIRDIRNLWKKYVIFQNKLYMPEVTFQEQGVELYAMLKKSLKIDELNTYLDEELNNLHDVAELENAELENRNDKRMNRSINVLTVAATAIAIVSVAQDFLAAIEFTNQPSENNIVRNSLIYLIGFIIIAAIIVIGIENFNNSDNRETRKNKAKKEDKKQDSYLKYLCFGFIFIIIVLAMFIIKTIFS